MDYGQLIHKAWFIVKRNRFLWWLGILAIWTEGGLSLGGSNFYDFGSSSTPSNPPQKIPTNLQGEAASLIKHFPRVLSSSAENTQYNALVDQFLSFISYNKEYLIIIALCLIILIIGFLYISYAAKAGLILSVNNLEKNDRSMGFAPAYRSGRQYAWRLFGLNLLIGLIIILILTALALPIALVFINKQSVTAIIIAAFFGFLVFAAALILGIYFNIVRRLAERSLVLKNQKIMESLEHGRAIFRRQRSESLIVWLIEIALGIAYGFAIFLALAVVVALLGGIGAAVYVVAHLTGLLIYLALAIIILLAVIIFAGGVFTSFISTYWTLAYQALIYLSNPKKEA